MSDTNPTRDFPIEVAADDLSNEIKIRSIALAMATRHHGEAVIQDADMYRMLKMENEHRITPLTPQMVVDTAVLFERYLLGEFSRGLTDDVLAEVMNEIDDKLHGVDSKAEP